MLAVLKVCVCLRVRGGYRGRRNALGTNHLVLEYAVFLVDFGTLCTVAPGHEVVELFLGESLGPVVRAGEAEDAFWLGHDDGGGFGRNVGFCLVLTSALLCERE